MRKASVVIRTMNEERWIYKCLKMVFSQACVESGNIELEVVIVDSGSADKTLDKARCFPVKIATVDQPYTPGKALNVGIRNTDGDVLVFLSAHCIPESGLWLEQLIEPLEKGTEVAGVYGRQLPIKASADQDKRDLINLFGLDYRVQKLDPFFHNANSAIPREIIERFPFDETVPHIEDRLWAKNVLDAGFHIHYNPDAAVFHWHGVHHDLKVSRAEGVVSVLHHIDSTSVAQNCETLLDYKALMVAPISAKNVDFLNEECFKNLQKFVAKFDFRFIFSVHQEVPDHQISRLYDFGTDSVFRRDSESFGVEEPLANVLGASLRRAEEVFSEIYDVVALVVPGPELELQLFEPMLQELIDTNRDLAIPVMSHSKSFWVFDGPNEEVMTVQTPFRTKSERGKTVKLGMPLKGVIIRAERLRLETFEPEIMSVCLYDCGPLT